MEGKLLILSRLAHLPSAGQFGLHKVVEEIVTEYKLTSLVNYREKGRRNDNANVKRVQLLARMVKYASILKIGD